MFLVISPRISLCVLQHRLEGILVIDAFQPLDEGVGNHDFRIRAALGSAITVTTTGIRHVTLTLVDIQQGVHDISLTLGIEQGDQR